MHVSTCILSNCCCEVIKPPSFFYLFKVGNWVCAQSSKTTVENCNKCITDKLEVRCRVYQHL